LVGGSTYLKGYTYQSVKLSEEMGKKRYEETQRMKNRKKE
jgi:hypothetical protein